MIKLTLRCHRWKQGFGWEVGTWSNLLFGRYRCSNRDNNLFKDKQVIEEWLSLLLSDERWSKWGNERSREKQGIEWVIQEWSKLLLNDGFWIKSNWVNNQSREKQGIGWKIVEWLNLLLNSSPMFQLRRRSIQRQRRDWMKNRSDRTYFSLVIDVSMNASIYPERNKRVN